MTLTWVVGAGGLVGRHLVARLQATGHEVMRRDIPWSDPDGSRDELALGIDELHTRAQGRPWSIAWCAGAGVVATGLDDLARELSVFTDTLHLLRSAPDGGAFFLASSAGGLYAGSTGPPFTEAHEPRPLVAYGETKLGMERVLAEVVRESGMRAFVGRLANVYGPGQLLAKPQGLLSQLCLADATGRALPIFVSLDTVRDYVYAPDCAQVIAAGMERARSLEPGAIVTKIIASGQPVTVGHLVGEARRVLHRPLRTVMVPGRGTGQVLDLRLRSTVWTDLDERHTATTLATGLDATARDILNRLARSGPDRLDAH